LIQDICGFILHMNIVMSVWIR